MPGRIRPAYYASHYCEENALRLSSDPLLLGGADDVAVVFVSNPARTVAMWSQVAAERPDDPVVWDYHVLVTALLGGVVHVFDLDSTLPFPVPLNAYAQGTFPLHGNLAPDFEPRFRQVPRESVLKHFSCDRSHMRTAHGWTHPPPPLPVFRAGDDAMNLWRWVDMEQPWHGKVLTLEGWLGEAT